LLPFDPFAPLSTLVRPSLRRLAFIPAADVAVSDTDIVLTFDVPGLTSDDVSIEVADNTLIVRGERRRGDAPEGTQYAHVERGVGRFERSVRLPAGVDPDAVTASLENGVLSLIVPKPAHVRPREIPIDSGDRAKELTAA
jgi:HSP20 family protein